MKISSRTHQGLVRLNNEDCVYHDVDAAFAILADGMGGLMAGAEASQVATWSSRKDLEADRHRERAMTEFVHSAHEAVANRARKKNYSGKMGTTLVLWRVNGACGEFAHVGDSRLYFYDNGELRQITKDMTVAQRMVDEGQFPAHEAHLAPNQNVLTQAIGIPGNLVPESGTTPLKGRLLLCSDGLSDLVADDQIAQALAHDDIAVVTEQLIKDALDKGGRDNISVIVIDLDD